MKPKLPKVLLAAVLATFSAVGSTVVAADIISINFYSKNTPTDVGVITNQTEGKLNNVGGSGWNNINCQERGSGTYTVTVNNGDETSTARLVLDYAPLGAWSSGVGSDLEDVLAHSYLDLQASTQYTVSFDNNYFVQEVILYFSGDNTGTFSSVNVNGASYVGGVDNPGLESWGSRASWTDNDHYYDQSTGALNAQKAIKVSHVFGALEVRNDIAGNSNNRATLAGMQIIDHTDSVYSATLLANQDAADGTITWTKGKGENVVTKNGYASIEAADRLLQVTAHADGSTMTLASGDTIDMLAVMENALTVTSEGAVKVNSLYAEQNATLNFGANLQSDSSVHVAGNGAVNLTGSLNIASLINTSTLTIGGTSTLGSLGNGAGTMNINAGTTVRGALSNSGTLNINADTTVSGAFSNTGTLTVAQNKTLTINGSATQEVTANPIFGTLFANSGEGNITINGSVDFHRQGLNNARTYEQQATTVLVNGNLIANGEGNTEWVVGSGKTLKATGDMAFKRLQTLKVTGGTVTVGERLILGHEASGDFSGHLRLEGGQLTAKSLYLRQGAGNDTVVMTGGTLEFTDGAAASVITRDTQTTGTPPESFGHLSTVTITGGTLQAMNNSWTADLGAGGSAMAVSGVTIKTGNDHTITLGHANVSGTITNNGNLALTNATLADGTTITNTGNLTLGTVTNSGAATLNGNITLSGTITDNGSLDLTGAQVSILGMDGFTRDERAEVTYTGGQVNGNGFETSQYIIVAGSGSGNRGLSVSYEGSDQNLQDGKLGGKIYGTFHVNSGTESVSAINTAATGHNTSAISMANGTTLTVDAALGDKHINVNGAATADIGENQSVNSSSITVANGAALTLTGYGSYEVGKDSSGHIYLHSGGREKVALGSGWKGNVIVEGISGAVNVNLNDLGHKGSTVTLKGSSGYFLRSDGEQESPASTAFTANLKLEKANGGTVAYEISNGYAGDCFIFEGDVAGAGDLVYNTPVGSSEGKYQTFEFVGNVSQWEGKLENVRSHGIFRFKGDATEVNINTIQTRTNGADYGNKMNLEFDHAKAATVNSIIQKAEDAGSSEIKVTVKNTSAEGTTFTKNVSANSLTVGDNTKATFKGTTSAGTLETGVGSTLSGAVAVASTATINGTVKGNGIQWNPAENTHNTLTLNTVYDVGNANVLTTMAAGSTINFGETGQIVLGTTGQGNTGLAGKNLALTASLTLNEVVMGNMVVTDTLWLIKGTDIYGRTGENALVNFDASSVTGSNAEGNVALTRYALATSLDDAWTLPESTAALMRAATEPGVGAYRFVSTGDGIGIQYFQNVPEPATATLGLLALAGLCARRRRR